MLGTGDPDSAAALEAVRAAALLGWLSISAVFLVLAIGLPVENQGVVLVTAVAASVGQAGLGLLPWPRLLSTSRGRWVLNLWSAALVAGVSALVLTAGGESRLDLLFFLVVPFLAIVHHGRTLVSWLTVTTLAVLAVTLSTADPLSRPETVLLLLLLAASATLGRQLAGAIRAQSFARVEATRRAELEGAMLAEGHHRVKNSLQVVADLLLLGRPEGEHGLAFEHADARIRSIAAVHGVLADRGGGLVPADELLRAVVSAANPAGTSLKVDPVSLQFQLAQNLGVVVNEFVTNAYEHGVAPVSVSLRLAGDGEITLEVTDSGPGPSHEDWDNPGLGLRLVRQVVEHGLRGKRFLGEPGSVRVRFDSSQDARSRS